MTVWVLTANRDCRGRIGVGSQVAGHVGQSVVEGVGIIGSRAKVHVDAGVGVADATHMLSVQVTLKVAVAVVVSATEVDVTEVLQARDVAATEGGVVVVIGTDTEHTSRSDDLATRASPVDVVDFVDAARSDGTVSPAASKTTTLDFRLRNGLSGVGLLGVCGDALVKRGGGSDEVNHGVKGLGDGKLGRTGHLDVGGLVAEPFVLGVEERFHLGNGDGELDPTDGR